MAGYVRCGSAVTTVVSRRIEIEQFRAAISRRLGFRIDDSRLDELADLLRQRMTRLGAASIEDYLREFETSREELRAVAGHVTVCETYFFRIPEHYRALAEAALPERMRAQSERRRLAVLSAGCSSGEEAYSIAMVIRENVHDLASWQVAIRGVDVNPVVIERARKARYSEWSLRDLAANVRQRYFERNSKQFHLEQAIREMVSFEEGNLLDFGAGFWQRDAYDVIFLRNVLMYFGPDTAGAVMSRVAECLLPGGYLFLGTAETLRGLSTDFHLCHTHDIFYYQRREPSELRAARQPRSAPVALPLTSPDAPGQSLAPPEPQTSWFDDIRRASERIQRLSQGPADLRPHSKETPAAAKPEGSAGPHDVKLALEFLRQERFADALSAIHGFPSESQGDPDVQLLRAVLLANGGNLAEAEEACKALLATEELNAGAHYVMALCREHAGDRNGAAEHDRIAIYLDSAFAMPHLHLGLLAKRDSRFDAACHELRQASLLLAHEDSSRVLLFGGGFGREALIEMCRRELRACGGAA
jgi:chemotaxis protein methyltransferase CheR